MTSSKPPGLYPEDVKLHSKRLTLRTFRRSDLDVEDSWPDFTEPIYRHYNPLRDDGYSKDRRYLEGLNIFDLKLAILEGGINVGYVGLYDSDARERSAWMGIQFAADQRSKGYCKESLTLLCDAFFHDWRMERMSLEVAIFNLMGVRCYERVGFRMVRQFWHHRAYQRRLDYERDERLAPIRQHFRKGAMGVEVEYLEMIATRETFDNRR